MRAPIGSGTRRWILCARGDATGLGRPVPIRGLAHAQALLTGERAGLVAIRRLLVSHLGLSVRRLDDRAVLAATARLLASGSLLLFDPAIPVRAASFDRVTVFEPELLEEKPVTWIEIVLLDEADRPCVGERYRIVLPDESIVEGRLGRDGRARVDGIESPGTCRISFPDLDEGASCAIDAPRTPPGPPAGPPPEPPKPTTWLEIELVDESDGPVAGERYEVTLPDGTVRAGTLDAAGRARFDGVPEGAHCRVTFPDLDRSAWEAI